MRVSAEQGRVLLCRSCLLISRFVWGSAGVSTWLFETSGSSGFLTELFRSLEKNISKLRVRLMWMTASLPVLALIVFLSAVELRVGLASTFEAYGTSNAYDPERAWQRQPSNATSQSPALRPLTSGRRRLQQRSPHSPVRQASFATSSRAFGCRDIVPPDNPQQDMKSWVHLWRAACFEHFCLSRTPNMYVCMYACMHVRTSLSLSIYIYISTFMYMLAFPHRHDFGLGDVRSKVEILRFSQPPRNAGVP